MSFSLKHSRLNYVIFFKLEKENVYEYTLFFLFSKWPLFSIYSFCVFVQRGKQRGATVVSDQLGSLVYPGLQLGCHIKPGIQTYTAPSTASDFWVLIHSCSKYCRSQIYWSHLKLEHSLIWIGYYMMNIYMFCLWINGHSTRTDICVVQQWSK